MRSSTVVLLAASLCALAGCVHTHTYDDVLSTRPLGPAELERLVRLPAPVEGTSRGIVVFLIVPLTFHYPTMERAFHEAIDAVPGCVALAEVDIEFGQVLSPVYASGWYRVRGIPLVETAAEAGHVAR